MSSPPLITVTSYSTLLQTAVNAAQPDPDLHPGTMGVLQETVGVIQRIADNPHEIQNLNLPLPPEELTGVDAFKANYSRWQSAAVVMKRGDFGQMVDHLEVNIRPLRNLLTGIPALLLSITATHYDEAVKPDPAAVTLYVSRTLFLNEEDDEVMAHEIVGIEAQFGESEILRGLNARQIQVFSVALLRNLTQPEDRGFLDLSAIEADCESLPGTERSPLRDAYRTLWPRFASLIALTSSQS